MAFEIDFYLRLTIIIALLGSSIYIMLLGLKEKEIRNKKKFNYTFSLFFLFTGINYILSEIEIWKKIKDGIDATIYPILIDRSQTYPWFFGSPIDSDIYMFTILIASLIPMIYALEKYVLMKKRSIFALIGTLAVVLDLILFAWHANWIFINIVHLSNYVVAILMGLRLIILYLNMAVKSAGEVRLMGILLGLGFILSIFGVLGTSLEGLFGDTSEIIGHFISLAGAIVVLVGVLKMK